jgi:hypothetical protein
MGERGINTMLNPDYEKRTREEIQRLDNEIKELQQQIEIKKAQKRTALHILNGRPVTR